MRAAALLLLAPLLTAGCTGATEPAVPVEPRPDDAEHGPTPAAVPVLVEARARWLGARWGGASPGTLAELEAVRPVAHGLEVLFAEEGRDRRNLTLHLGEAALDAEWIGYLSWPTSVPNPALWHANVRGLLDAAARHDPALVVVQRAAFGGANLSFPRVDGPLPLVLRGEMRDDVAWIAFESRLLLPPPEETTPPADARRGAENRTTLAVRSDPEARTVEDDALVAWAAPGHGLLGLRHRLEVQLPPEVDHVEVLLLTGFGARSWIVPIETSPSRDGTT